MLSLPYHVNDNGLWFDIARFVRIHHVRARQTPLSQRSQVRVPQRLVEPELILHMHGNR